MAGLLSDDKDIQFVLFDLLTIQSLINEPRFGDWNKKSFRLILDEARRLSEKVLFPLSIEGDRTGAQFSKGQVFSVPGTKDAYRAFVQGGWLTPCEDESIGGQGLPKIIKYATHELFLSANFPFMCYANLSHDAGKLVEKFGTEEQKKKYLGKLYAGLWTGTMAITETGAGSDVGAIETKASPNSDNTFSISGQKIFITNGEHDIAENIVHMVLARIEGDPTGTKGLSLFIVPKYRVNEDGTPGEANDVRCIGIEHKMGLHGSPTTTMLFGENGGCNGLLIGKAREGIQTMFHMINSSRLEVGIWGLGTASAAYRHALNYAKGRAQGASLSKGAQGNQAAIVEHPDIRSTLVSMKAYVEGMRALLYYCGYAMDLMESGETNELRAKWRDRIELLTPICKAYPTEKAVQIASQAIQIYGGSGYLMDYPVAQFFRDVKVACIFEGTTGIQAIDFTLRKATRKNGHTFIDLLEELSCMVRSATDVPELRPYARQLEKAGQAIADVPSYLNDCMKREGVFYPLLKATPFLDAAGDVLLAYFLMWGALIAREKLEAIFRQQRKTGADERAVFIRKNAKAAHLAGKIESAKFFIANILPITDGKIAALKWNDTSAWDIEAASL